MHSKYSLLINHYKYVYIVYLTIQFTTNVHKIGNIFQYDKETFFCYILFF